MQNEAVIDIETKNTFSDVEGSQGVKGLRISVVCAYFSDTNTYESFEEHELPKLWKRLEEMDRIIGYNILHFDFPVMNNYYAGDFLKFNALDLLVEVEKGLGFRVKLDDLAQANLGSGKTGTGLLAVELYKQGKIKELKDYCMRDVEVTRLLYERGLAYGKLLFNDRFSGMREVPVDFSFKSNKQSTVNLTIPF
ncbi:MAG: hypothetical protein ACD_76C00009G0001 [uncultured bacterium]|nr:MAG: hypothetical protein ACD_76C00009G0001 [uncultured bacterium]HBD04846.1 hypothetical protein [Candidatus Uhrbacteria bacterium]